MKISLFGLHVQPAENEVNFTIAELMADIKRRNDDYESGESARRAWGEGEAERIMAGREAAREAAAGPALPGAEQGCVSGPVPVGPQVAADGHDRGGGT
jgi:hypothetical protein